MSEALRTLKERGFFAQCTDEDGLGRLLDKETVGFYVGIDPTGSSMHIGHLVPLYAMAHLARAGHRAVPLIGGGTARIGDPSGKTETRKMLTVEQIDANVERMSAQIVRFLESAGASGSVVNNVEWLAGLNYIEFLRDIGRHFSVNRMLTFETYRMRMETGLSFIEFNYQLLQSFDFLELYRNHGVRLQIGGDDQWGNIVAGVDLIRRVEAGEAFGLTFPLVTRADGKKMGKTEKGALFLDSNLTSVYDFFQYWVNVDDRDVSRFLRLYTMLAPVEIEKLEKLQGAEIREAKKVLAREVTTMVHGAGESDAAEKAATALFSGGSDDSTVPSSERPASDFSGEGLSLLDALTETGLMKSKGEARRMIRQKAVRVGGDLIEDETLQLTGKHIQDGKIQLQVGKKRHHHIQVIP